MDSGEHQKLLKTPCQTILFSQNLDYRTNFNSMPGSAHQTRRKGNGYSRVNTRGANKRFHLTSADQQHTRMFSNDNLGLPDTTVNLSFKGDELLQATYVDDQNLMKSSSQLFTTQRRQRGGSEFLASRVKSGRSG